MLGDFEMDQEYDHVRARENSDLSVEDYVEEHPDYRHTEGYKREMIDAGLAEYYSENGRRKFRRLR